MSQSCFLFSVKILPLICTLALVKGAVRASNHPSQAVAICAAPGSDSVLVAHEDCSKFYKCWQGIPVALDCPKPLVYNSEKEWCDWPWNVNCNRENIEEEDHGTGSSGNEGDYTKNAEKICAKEGSHGVVLPHEVCSKYYMCGLGKPFAYDCISFMVYNIEHNACEWPQNVDCGNRT